MFCAGRHPRGILIGVLGYWGKDAKMGRGLISRVHVAM